VRHGVALVEVLLDGAGESYLRHGSISFCQFPPWGRASSALAGLVD